jgi:hypothetical protein
MVSRASPTTCLLQAEIVARQVSSHREDASARWAGGVDLSMMPEAGLLDPADKPCREYEEW